MILHIPAVLSEDSVRRCNIALAGAEWADGRVTAGVQSGLAKNNMQLPEAAPESRTLGDIVLNAIGASPHFMSAALPLRVFPPLFNRYSEGMGFGAHIDNAIRAHPLNGGRYRTDLSCTIFLSDPERYDGGELVIGEGFDARRVKLPAGDMVLYPSTSVHHVEPIVRGERLASVFWVQSMIADTGQRDLLYEMDNAITATRAELGDDHPAALGLTGSYHNLMRMWSQL